MPEQNAANWAHQPHHPSSSNCKEPSQQGNEVALDDFVAGNKEGKHRKGGREEEERGNFEILRRQRRKANFCEQPCHSHAVFEKCVGIE